MTALPDVYLQPEADGFATRESGPWAAEKLDYLGRYINAFETSMREKWDPRCYIDLLAGPGKDRVRGSDTVLLGSPLLALTTTYPFTHYFFTDLSPENTQALQERCESSPLCGRVSVRTGDCNQLVDDIVSDITGLGPDSLNLAFLDPQGIKDLRWETVAKLATLRRMDLIVHYPQYGLQRNMPQACAAEAETVVDRFFGGREWREVYEAHAGGRLKGGLHRNLIDLYKAKLRDLGYQVDSGQEPLIRNIVRQAPLYRLLFASKHPLGQEFWENIVQRNVYGQRRLF